MVFKEVAVIISLKFVSKDAIEISAQLWPAVVYAASVIVTKIYALAIHIWQTPFLVFVEGSMFILLDFVICKQYSEIMSALLATICLAFFTRWLFFINWSGLGVEPLRFGYEPNQSTGTLTALTA